ncbi:MAG TPA: hypothetical protein VFH23_06830 [Jiangellaceae bacterium]|nr:hypothetical protein [Jiangellaceae bacterium]
MISVLNGIREEPDLFSEQLWRCGRAAIPRGLGFQGCAAHAIAGRVASGAQAVGRTPP